MKKILTITLTSLALIATGCTQTTANTVATATTKANKSATFKESKALDEAVNFLKQNMVGKTIGYDTSRKILGDTVYVISSVRLSYPSVARTPEGLKFQERVESTSTRWKLDAHGNKVDQGMTKVRSGTRYFEVTTNSLNDDLNGISRYQRDKANDTTGRGINILNLLSLDADKLTLKESGVNYSRCYAKDDKSRACTTKTTSVFEITEGKLSKSRELRWYEVDTTTLKLTPFKEDAIMRTIAKE